MNMQILDVHKNNVVILGCKGSKEDMEEELQGLAPVAKVVEEAGGILLLTNGKRFVVCRSQTEATEK